MPKDPEEKKLAEPAKQKKFFDIARPGNTPASSNSRAGITGNKVPGDISGITPAERKPIMATNPLETHRSLIGSKARVVVQPAGTFNKTIEPTEAMQPAAPAPLEEFDISSLSKRNIPAEPRPSQEATAFAAVGQPAPVPVTGLRQEAATGVSDPDAASDDPEPEWLAKAEKDLKGAPPDPTTVPATMILDASPPGGIKLGKALLIIGIVLVALIVGLVIFANVVSFGP